MTDQAIKAITWKHGSFKVNGDCEYADYGEWDMSIVDRVNSVYTRLPWIRAVDNMTGRVVFWNTSEIAVIDMGDPNS